MDKKDRKITAAHHVTTTKDHPELAERYRRCNEYLMRRNANLYKRLAEK